MGTRKIGRSYNMSLRKKINVMKLLKTFFSVAFLIIIFSTESKAQVNPSSTYVSGYTRSDGTYVSGYYKTTPNSTNRDNYTTKPNTNPYTVTSGYIQPDNKPLSSNGSYSTPVYIAPTTFKSSSSYPTNTTTGPR